eukprot:2823284-Pyramimonas_sp.AAC.1
MHCTTLAPQGKHHDSDAVSGVSMQATEHATAIIAVVPRNNVEVVNVDCCDLDAVRAAITDNTKLVMLESPTNPRMQIVDIRAISAMAHAKGAIVMVDNSIMAPVFQ